MITGTCQLAYMVNQPQKNSDTGEFICPLWKQRLRYRSWAYHHWSSSPFNFMARPPKFLIKNVNFIVLKYQCFPNHSPSTIIPWNTASALVAQIDLIKRMIRETFWADWKLREEINHPVLSLLTKMLISTMPMIRNIVSEAETNKINKAITPWYHNCSVNIPTINLTLTVQ